MMSIVIRSAFQDPEQHWICFRMRLQPTMSIWLETVWGQPTTPHALLRPVALALVGALAGLVALPLGQHALDAALKLAELRCLLLRLAAVDHIDAQRRHLGFELAPLKIVAMTTVDRLETYTVKLVSAGGGEQVLIVNALGRTCAAAGLVDIFRHHPVGCGARLGAQTRQLIRDTKAMLHLIVRRAAEIEGSSFHTSVPSSSCAS